MQSANSFTQLAADLASAASTLLEVQLSCGRDPDKFLATYANNAGSGYVQLPFLRDARHPRNDSFVWTEVRRGSRILGQVGGVLVPGNAQARHSLSDALAQGLLYSPDAAWLEKSAWLPGAGKGILTDAPSLYFGGGWVHPELRGLGLVGVLSRLTALQALAIEPNLQTVWGLEEDALLKKGNMAAPRGLGITHSEKVFEGFSELVGRPVVFHAIWATRAEYLELLARDREALRLEKTPHWLGAAAPAGVNSAR